MLIDLDTFDAQRVSGDVQGAKLGKMGQVGHGEYLLVLLVR